MYDAMAMSTRATTRFCITLHSFTSLCAYMAAAWWEGKVNLFTCMR